MIEINLREALVNNLAVSVIVDGKVFAGMGEGNLVGQTYIVYRLLHGDRGATLKGVTDLRQARMEINCYSPQYALVKELAEAAQAAIEDAFDCMFNGDQDFYENDTALHRVMLDYSIWEND